MKATDAGQAALAESLRSLPQGLRARAHELRRQANASHNDELRRKAEAEASMLAQRAERMEGFLQNPEIVEPTIRRLESGLRSGISDEVRRRRLEILLADAKQVALAIQRQREAVRPRRPRRARGPGPSRS